MIENPMIVRIAASSFKLILTGKLDERNWSSAP